MSEPQTADHAAKLRAYYAQFGIDVNDLLKEKLVLADRHIRLNPAFDGDETLKLLQVSHLITYTMKLQELLTFTLSFSIDGTATRLQISPSDFVVAQEFWFLFTTGGFSTVTIILLQRRENIWTGGQLRSSRCRIIVYALRSY
jgi:hypothetical protein